MKKYVLPIVYSLGILLIGSLLSSTLYYFNITSEKLNTIILYLVSIIAMFTGATKLGKSINQKGIITGLIYYTVFLCLMVFLSLVIFKINMGFKSIIYYLVLLVFSILGGIVGKNMQEETDMG